MKDKKIEQAVERLLDTLERVDKQLQKNTLVIRSMGDQLDKNELCVVCHLQADWVLAFSDVTQTPLCSEHYGELATNDNGDAIFNGRASTSIRPAFGQMSVTG